MFATPVCLRGEHLPCAFALLQPIPRSKYPALSAPEEAVSRGDGDLESSPNANHT